jgi:ADP-ribosylation factor protein 1
MTEDSNHSWWDNIKSIFSFNRNDKPLKKTILLGLDASGKTTMLYRLKHRKDEIVTTIPTIGFNVETVTINRAVDCKCWDVGGCDKLYALWRYYLDDIDFLMFMFDSNDIERSDAAAEELHRTLQQPQLKERCNTGKPIPILIFANKQDLPNAKSALEVVNLL